MSIEILGTANNTVQTAATPRAVSPGSTTIDSVQTERKPSANDPAVADTVTFTDTAVRLQQLVQKLQAVPEVNIQRVATLQKLIEQGQYIPNDGHTAAKFLQIEGRRALTFPADALSKR